MWFYCKFVIFVKQVNNSTGEFHDFSVTHSLYADTLHNAWTLAETFSILADAECSCQGRVCRLHVILTHSVVIVLAAVKQVWEWLESNRSTKDDVFPHGSCSWLASLQALSMHVTIWIWSMNISACDRHHRCMTLTQKLESDFLQWKTSIDGNRISHSKCNLS